MPMSFKNLVRAWIAPGGMGLDEFDEEWYLFKYPDVAAKVRSGQLQSGRQHFIRYGFAEDREGSAAGTPPSAVDCSFDEFKITASGAVFFKGWVDSVASPADALVMEAPGTRWHFGADQLYRHRREDVEATLAVSRRPAEHGLWLFKSHMQPADAIDYNISFTTAKGLVNKARLRPDLVTDTEMRDIVLEFFNTRWQAGNLQQLDVTDSDRGFGSEIIQLNRRILRNSKHSGVRKFGATPRLITKSFITCLYGLPEFLPLQVALFSDSRQFNEVEFVYVNNSPEHRALLEQEAKQAARLYDVPITVIHSDTNIGFAAANNLAARHASSDRLLFINPDVLPKERDWLIKHDKFAATGAGKFFGGCLYYDDGSAMHAGMYFVRDSFLDGQMGSAELLDTWHFAKGFPDWVPDVRTTRIVPAVTGAFMSIERAHFERLGGFDEDYIFGHYEDGDLCMKSAAAGVPVWYCADVRLWHLEGKGSKKSGRHDGARRVNRWHLTKKWAPSVEAAEPGTSTGSEMMRKARVHAR